MSFLEDFDDRAKAQAAGRKPGDPAPEGENPSNRELLDFADLIRARRALPDDAERQRVLDRVRQAAPRASRPPVQTGRLRSDTGQRPRTPILAIAALVGLTVGLALLQSRFIPPARSNRIASERQPVTGRDARPTARPATAPPPGRLASTRPPNEEFANLEFPAPKVREGGGAAVETPAGADAARLTRVQGLAMFQLKGTQRWRVGAHGQALAPGDVVRASKRLDSCIRILGPDGSAVSMSTGAAVRYDGPRAWNLLEGSAYFEVASRKELDAFTVTTPHGTARALGTRFSLDVSKPDEGAYTRCWVDDGKVAVAARNNSTWDVESGKSAVLSGDRIIPNFTRYSKDWLAALERVAENDHGIGQLVAKAEKANEHLPLEVKSHSVNVTVVDQVARTLVDEVFINNTDRRLEGTFYYPLPADASISEFAMYVGEQRIVGEVLEQQRARQIFEYIVRQQRDPALLEYAGGNLFKMRVFPIEPHSEKRIQLGYTQILPRSSGKVSYTYPLYSEMLLKNPLLDLKIEFRVISSPGLSDLASPTHDAPSALSADGKRGSLAFRAKKYSPTRDFSVTYSVPDAAECVAFANLRPDDPEGYFMLQLCPKVQLAPRDPPQRLLVVVDGSASAGAQEYAVATEFAASAADVSGNWQFGVLRGGLKPEFSPGLGMRGPGLAYADADTSTNVRDFLQKNPPLGATDLLEIFRQARSRARSTAGAGKMPALQIVYVGDGIDTVSELAGPALVEQIAALFKGTDIKVSTVAVGSSYDRSVLQGIASKLGGTFSRVEGAADVHAGVSQVFDSFYRPLLWDMSVSFSHLNVRNGSEFIGTVPAGDTAIVLGRFVPRKGPSARLRVTAHVDGNTGPEGAQVQRGRYDGTGWVERAYDVDLTADEQSNRFLPRLWAKAHIDALQDSLGLSAPGGDARIKQQIIQASIDYQIMSPFTAFLVLESEEDYERFGIKRKLKMWDWTGDAPGRGPGKRQWTVDMFSNAPDTISGSEFVNAPDFPGPEFQITVTRGNESFFDSRDGGLSVDINGSPATWNSAFPFEVSNGLGGSLGDPFAAPARLSDLSADSTEVESLGRSLAFDQSKADDFEELRNERSESYPAEYKTVTDFDSFGVEQLAAAEPAALSQFRFFGTEATYFRRRGYGYGVASSGYEPQYTSLVFPPAAPGEVQKIQEIQVDQPLQPLAYYQRLLLSGKGTLSTRLNLALALEQLGRFDDALKALAPVLEKAPQAVDLWLEDGVLRYRAGDAAGGKAAFAKALALAPAPLEERAALQARVAALWDQLEQQPEHQLNAAELYSALARGAASAEKALEYARNADNDFAVAGQQPKAGPLWEELLKRWPNHGKIMAAAGEYYARQDGQFERGVALVRAARKLDPAINEQLVRACIERGEFDAARAEFREVLATAVDAGQVYSALDALGSAVPTGAEGGATGLSGLRVPTTTGRRSEAAREALQLLGAGHNAAQIAGAVQYIQSYGVLRDRASIEAFAAAAQRNDFPAQARVNAFHALAQFNPFLRSLKMDAATVLEPLCQNPRTEQDWELAMQALNLMHTYSFPEQALEHASKLRARKDRPQAQGLPPGHDPFADRASLLEIELAALEALGRHPEREAEAMKALTAPGDEKAALYPAWVVLQARLGRGEIEGAAKVAEAFAQRFPDSPYLSRYYSQIVQRLHQDKKKEEAAALVEKLAQRYPRNPAFVEMRARALAAQGKFQDAAQAVRAGLDGRTGVPARRDVPAGRDTALPQGETPALRAAQRERMIQLLAKLCGQDAELRAEFLKEADANARSEHPALREWTEAALTCLGAAGDVAGQLKRLQGLAQAEPGDPVWTRRYAGALLAARKLEDARQVLTKLSDADPGDADLALALQDLCARLKDAPAAEKYFARTFAALEKQPDRMQEYAGQWMQAKPLWALKAWTHLFEKRSSPGSGSVSSQYAANQAAAICQQLGREKDAAEFYFRALALGESDYYAQDALKALIAMAGQEEHLRTLLPKTRAALDALGRAGVPARQEDAKSPALMLNLLLYHLEMLRASTPGNDLTNARQALDAAAAQDIPDNNYSAGLLVVDALLKDGQFERAEKYALEGGGKLSEDSRRQFIRQAVSAHFRNTLPQTSDNPQAVYVTQRARGIRMLRGLLEGFDSNRENDQAQLVELLIADGQLAAAEAEVRQMFAVRYSGNVYSAWQHLVQLYRNKKDFAKAVPLALECWQTLRDDPNYGASAFSQVIEVCNDALKPEAKLDPETRKRAREAIRQAAKAYFAGDTEHSYWRQYTANALDNLGLQDDLAVYADEAAASSDPHRVARSAAYVWQHLHQFDAGKKLYLRALTLPGVDEKAIHGELYNLLCDPLGVAHQHQPEWGEGIAVLEKLKQLNAYDETRYLSERGRCLYGLKRTEEARAVYRKLLASPAYWRQGYWSVQDLAHQLQEQKDWVMAAEVWELAIKLLRRQSRGQIDASNAASFYKACALAYAQLGEKDKALDCFLRGLSVLPRTDSHYQELVDAALEHALNGQALEKAVQEYEKSVAGSAGVPAGGEKPHLRIVFSDGYRREAGNAGDTAARNDATRAMLKHLGIAADLLPKDMQLRQQVIDGYKQLKDTEAALAAYREWAKFDPQNIEIYRGLGDFFKSLGRHEEALLAWATMAEIRPREAEGYRAYAQKLVSLVGPASLPVYAEKAAAAYRHALRYRPTEFDISKELAAVYKSLKQDDKIPALWAAGEAACRKAMEDFADDPQPWLSLGLFLGAQKRGQDEAELYRRILQRSWPRFQSETHEEAKKRLAERARE